MDKTLRIRVEDGYEYFSIAGKTVRSTVAPVFKGFRKVLEFEPEAGYLLMETEFQLLNGTRIVDEEPVSLNDLLCWAFHDPDEVIQKIEVIVLE